MATNFTQAISMDCTKEQYEKYLKEGLLKMGYKECSVNFWDDNRFHHICNNYNGCFGDLGTICKVIMEGYDRTYLGSFNAALFLALAAMTDKAEGNYGEYVIGLRSGKIYKMDEEDKISPEYTLVRKATKEEIMAKFGEKKCNHNTLEKKIDQLNKNGQIEINISFDATGLNKEFEKITEQTAKEISEAMSDIWYKIDQYHIAALKSKGYKILKPTTWEEV